MGNPRQITIDPYDLRGNDGYLLGQMLHQHFAENPEAQEVSLDILEGDLDVRVDIEVEKRVWQLKPNRYAQPIPYQVEFKLGHWPTVFKRSDTEYAFAEGSFGKGGVGELFKLTRWEIFLHDDGTQEVKLKKGEHKWLWKIVQTKPTPQLTRTIDQETLSHISHLHAKKASSKQPSPYSHYIMHQFEYLTLFEIVSDYDLSVDLKFEINRRVFEAIQEQIHDKGYRHNDIKQNNILLDIDFEMGIVRDVKIIDIDDVTLANAPLTWRGAPAIAAPEVAKLIKVNAQSNKVHEGHGSLAPDYYTSGITAAILWSLSDENLLRNVISLQSIDINFKPKFKFNIHFLGKITAPQILKVMRRNTKGLEHCENLSKALRACLAALCRFNPKERMSVKQVLPALNDIELAHTLSNVPEDVQVAVTKANQNGKDCRNEILKCISENNNITVRLQTALKIFNSYLGNLENSASLFVVHEFTKMFQANVFRDLFTVQQVKDKATEIINAFSDNVKKLTELYDKLADYPAHQKEIKRLYKKMNKRISFDEMDSFNTLYTERINKIYAVCLQSSKEVESVKIIDNKPKKTSSKDQAVKPTLSKRKLDAIDIYLKMIEQAKSPHELALIFYKLKGPSHRYLREEQGTLMRFLGKYGATTTWCTLIHRLQRRAIELLKDKREEKHDNKQEDKQYELTHEQEHLQLIEKFIPIFAERNNRVFKINYQNEFNRLATDHKFVQQPQQVLLIPGGRQ